MWRALLLLSLTLGPAAAVSAPTRMGDLPRPVTSGPTRLAEARPTLDLLVTVRLLDLLLERGTLTPGVQGRAELASELRSLRTQPTLGPLNAERSLGRLRAALTSAERRTLDTARTDYERRADLLLVRARFATPDGPANVALLRYGFMVPGNLSLVQRIAANPTLNPYAEAGLNAGLLARVLDRLRS